MPYLKIGDLIKKYAEPYTSYPVLDEKIVHFLDSFANLGNWNVTSINASYSTTSEGLYIETANGTFELWSKSEIPKKSHIALYVKFKVLSTDSKITLAGIRESSDNENGAEILVDGGGNIYMSALYGFYGGRPTSPRATYPVGEWYEIVIVIIGNCVLMFHKSPDGTSWIRAGGLRVDVDPSVFASALKYLHVKITGTSRVIISRIAVYEASGDGISDIIPVIDGSTGKILTDGTYYYFVATELYVYFSEFSRTVVLRTTDFVDFEIVKHLTIKEYGYYGTLYSIKLGDRVYLWTTGPQPYQNGVHWFCLAELDVDFNFIDVHEDVVINNAPPDFQFTTLYFVNVGGKWYAITDGLHLLEAESPISRTLDYVGELLSGPYRGSVSAVLATDGTNTYVMVTDFNADESKVEVHLFDTNFNYIQTIGELSNPDFYDEGVYLLLLPFAKLLYMYLVSFDSFSTLDIYAVDSDMYDAAYLQQPPPRKPTSLTLTITPL
jgi:hypothetical protein